MSCNIHFHTFGCKVNFVDSDFLMARIKSLNVESIKDYDIQIINSCAVTNNAVEDLLKYLKHLVNKKKNNSNIILILMGCAVQVMQDTWKSPIKDINIIVGNSHKFRLPEIIKEYIENTDLLKTKIYYNNLLKKRNVESYTKFLNLQKPINSSGDDLDINNLDTSDCNYDYNYSYSYDVDKIDDLNFIFPDDLSVIKRTRYFLKIQDGCNRFCSYCIVPYTRGRSYSIPYQFLLDRINKVYEIGFKEIVITGIHIADYSYNGLKFYDLLRLILKHTSIPRIRLSSLDPKEINDDLMKILQNERFCLNLHLSVQNFNNKVLRDMKRNYKFEDIENVLLRINKFNSNTYVAIDIISGFPTESEDDFLDSLKKIQKLPWTKLHVFPYSERQGTLAERKYSVLPKETVKERAKKLQKMSKERMMQEAQKQINNNLEVLFLTDSPFVEGISSNYWKVVLRQESKLKGAKFKCIKFKGTIAKVKILEVINKNNSYDSIILSGELM